MNSDLKIQSQIIETFEEKAQNAGIKVTEAFSREFEETQSYQEEDSNLLNFKETHEEIKQKYRTEEVIQNVSTIDNDYFTRIAEFYKNLAKSKMIATKEFELKIQDFEAQIEENKQQLNQLLPQMTVLKENLEQKERDLLEKEHQFENLHQENQKETSMLLSEKESLLRDTEQLQSQLNQKEQLIESLKLKLNSQEENFLGWQSQYQNQIDELSQRNQELTEQNDYLSSLIRESESKNTFEDERVPHQDFVQNYIVCSPRNLQDTQQNDFSQSLCEREDNVDRDFRTTLNEIQETKFQIEKSIIEARLAYEQSQRFLYQQNMLQCSSLTADFGESKLKQQSEGLNELFQIREINEDLFNDQEEKIRQRDESIKSMEAQIKSLLELVQKQQDHIDSKKTEQFLHENEILQSKVMMQEGLINQQQKEIKGLYSEQIMKEKSLKDSSFLIKSFNEKTQPFRDLKNLSMHQDKNTFKPSRTTKPFRMEDDCTPRKSDDEFPNAPEFEVQMN